jgi:transcriptional regulator with XRE-family HTH domain
MTGRQETGACLRALRVLRGWNQRQAAAAARLPHTRLSDYERGKVSPTADRLEAIVAALGYPMLSFEIARQLRTTLGAPAAQGRGAGGRILELRGQVHEIGAGGVAVGVFVLPGQAAAQQQLRRADPGAQRDAGSPSPQPQLAHRRGR